MLPYSKFLNLIRNIQKNTLFDAVRPQIKAYVDNVYGSLDPFQAYKTVFELAHASTGAKVEPPYVDYLGQFGNMAKRKQGSDAYRADIKYGHWFYYFSLFSDKCGDPHYGERISAALFDGKSFFDKFEKELRNLGIARPSHLPPLETVPLGPVTVFLGYDVGLERLSLREPVDTNLQPDGRPDVFKALDWKSRLTQLHGRDDLRDEIVDWALEDKTKQVKVLLVSGPGGAGKTRLVAEATNVLVNQHNWTGGFLRDGSNVQKRIDGSGAGVALIIDYPEERTDLVKRIIIDAMSDTQYQKPVRIILASRENLQTWKDILNRPSLERFKEISLDTNLHAPFLEIQDALNIARDVEEGYPARIDREKTIFLGVEEWLNQDAAHRLPLMALAAAVHAVLEPDKGFTLTGAEVLLALAAIERRRVRSYSERDLGDRDALEKLLSLSLLTSTGLTTKTILALGAEGICKDRTGEDLLLAIKRTPFWVLVQEESSGHILRPQPDRPAAAFFHLALRLDDPLPELPNRLATVAIQQPNGFVVALGRLTLDISLISTQASRNIETAAIRMLDLSIEPAISLKDSVISNNNKVNMRFSVEIFQKLLATKTAEEERNDMLNSLSIAYSNLGLHDLALETAEASAELARKLADANPDDYQPYLARSLATLAIRLSNLDRHHEALEPAMVAMETYKTLAKSEPVSYFSHFIAALNTLAIRLSKVDRHEEAMDLVERAVSAYRPLVIASPADFEEGFATLLMTYSTRLHNLSLYERALAPALEASKIYERLANRFPGEFTRDLAVATSFVSEGYYAIGDLTSALKYACLSVELCRNIFQANPDVYFVELSSSLKYISSIYNKKGKYKEARKAIEEVISIYGPLANKDPSQHLPDLAAYRSLRSEILWNDNSQQEALNEIDEAIGIFRLFVETNSSHILSALARCLVKQSKMFSQMGMQNEALARAEEAALIDLELAKSVSNSFLPELAISLQNLSKCLSILGYAEQAIKSSNDCISIYTSLANHQPLVFSAELAGALDEYSNLQFQCGNHVEALSASQEATRIFRDQCSRDPETHLPSLSRSLNSLTKQLSALGKYKEALPFAEEAVKIRRDLVTTRSEVFRSALATSLNSLANILAQIGQHHKAIATAKEAADIFELLSSSNLNSFGLNWSISLNTLANCLLSLGLYEEALGHAEKAVSIQDELAEARPRYIVPKVAVSLNTKATILLQMGRVDDGIRSIETAIDRLHPFCVQEPSLYAGKIYIFLSNYEAACSNFGVPPKQELVRPLKKLLDEIGFDIRGDIT